MERTELMVGEGAHRLRSGRLSRHPPNGESRQLTDDRMLWKGATLMLFAPVPTITTVFSNVAELRRYSLNLIVVPMGNRPKMTRRDVASDLPNSNEECEYFHGGTPRTPTTRGPAVAEFKDGSPTELQRRRVTGVSAHTHGTN
jgi:hypothetical protein